MSTTTGEPASPFATTANDEELDRELNQLVEGLVPIREVYEPEVLQALAKKLPRYIARNNSAVLLEWHGARSMFVVGMEHPDNAVHLRNIVRALGIQSQQLIPRCVAASRLEMLQAIAYEIRDDEVAHITDDYAKPKNDSARQTIDWNSLDSDAATATATADQNPSEHNVEIGLGTGLRAVAGRIILEAIKRRASDIHVIPGAEFGRIYVRTDGVKYPMIPHVPSARMENLANAFCDMAGVNGYEIMQHGKGAEIPIKLTTASGKVEKRTLRFHGKRSYFGRAIVIRIQNAEFRDFAQIGLEPSQELEMRHALDYRHGVILVTGATGSGKSNTLEAMLRSLEQQSKFQKHLIQIGDPIEFPNDLRTQLPVDKDAEWAEALKDAMRMDPDIFSPGEFRDGEGANIVFQAAATGHLTLTTLHTNNVAQTFSRLDFMNIGRDKQSDLLRLVASQELSPTLCPHCKAPDPNGREVADRLVEIVFPNRPDIRAALTTAQGNTPFFHAVGCPACHNLGVKGRTCIAEILHVTPDISRMLRKQADGEEIVDYAVRNHGMVTLAEAAARKLCRGQIAYHNVQHLLMTTNQSPVDEKYEWPVAAETNSDAARSETTYEAVAEPEPEEAIDAEFVDLDITTPPPPVTTHEPAQHAAAGFSMIELLIVVGIIAIIAAIAIPSMIRSKHAAYESAAKQKLATIGQQQTAFKTLLGKRRYGTIAELKAATSGGSPLLTDNDTTVNGWGFMDQQDPNTAAFSVAAQPSLDVGLDYSFYLAEDQVLRRCPFRKGTRSKTTCTPIGQ